MSRSTLWIDVTELFAEFRVSVHPTGISRVILNLADELRASPPVGFDRVVPLFWDPVTNKPITLDDWDKVGEARVFFPGLRRAYQDAGIERPSLRKGIKKGLITAIPRRLRYRLFPHLEGVPQFLRWTRQRLLGTRVVSFGPRDVLFVPGSFWLGGGYATRLADQAARAGMRTVAFVHDVYLLSHPQWWPSRHSEQFRQGANSFLPRCDLLICNSQHTIDETRKHVALPAHASFALCRLADRLQIEPQPLLSPDLAGKKFALFVSSVVPRKNHVLAVRAWSLLHRQFRDQTPELVLVGGGHPDSALAAALEVSARSGCRVARLTAVTDEQLAWLYRHAWLTLYPSLGEGFGLPVAESMAFGKVCIASSAGGLSEIAPGLVDVVDPHDPGAMAEAVRTYLLSPARLAAREACIRRTYRSTSWRDCAAVVGGLLSETSLTRDSRSKKT